MRGLRETKEVQEGVWDLVGGLGSRGLEGLGVQEGIGFQKGLGVQ